MKRRHLHLPILGLICAVPLLCSAVARADVAATRPAEVKDAGNSTRAAATAAAPSNRSLLDSQEIRHTDKTGAASDHQTNLPGLGLPRVAGALAVVIGLIFVLRWVAKKLFLQPNGGKAVRAIQVLARSPISHRQNIMLLRVGRRVIVVGDTGTQMNPLSEITDPDEVASLLGQLQEDNAHFPAKAFGAMVKRFRSDMGTDEEAMTEQETAETDVQPELNEEPVEDPSISNTREEITGLMDKVRVLSKTFRGGAT